MNEATINAIMNYGVLGLITLVFFKSYYEDKADSKEFQRKQLENEKQMAIILSQTMETVAKNNEVIEDNKTMIENTEEMHRDMGKTLDQIEDKLNELIKQSNQYEVILAVNSIKDMLTELVE